MYRDADIDGCILVRTLLSAERREPILLKSLTIGAQRGMERLEEGVDLGIVVDVEGWTVLD
jgi:hypothetical protein